MANSRENKDIEKAARKAGCEPVRQRGSHQTWQCPEGQFRLIKDSSHRKEQSPGVADKIWKVIRSQP